LGLRSLFSFLALGLFGAILVGQAQAQRLNVDAFLQEWDADRDGTLTLDEIKKAAAARFDALDRKKKGILSRSELAGNLTFQEFRKADTDKDGTLDKTEFLSAVEKRFQAADTDHDGTLDKKELESLAGRSLLRLFAIRQGPMM
jgi:Ca2+-binding EF-hand superfamily protein